MPAQSPHNVFLDGHGLPARWRGRGHFVILVTGFAQGEDVLAMWAAWRADPLRCDRLTVIAIDPRPQAPQVLGDGSHPLRSRLLALWPPMTPGWHQLWLDDVAAGCAGDTPSWERTNICG